MFVDSFTKIIHPPNHAHYWIQSSYPKFEDLLPLRSIKYLYIVCSSILTQPHTNQMQYTGPIKKK